MQIAIGLGIGIAVMALLLMVVVKAKNTLVKKQEEEMLRCQNQTSLK